MQNFSILGENFSIFILVVLVFSLCLSSICDRNLFFSSSKFLLYRCLEWPKDERMVSESYAHFCWKYFPSPPFEITACYMHMDLEDIGMKSLRHSLWRCDSCLWLSGIWVIVYKTLLFRDNLFIHWILQRYWLPYVYSHYLPCMKWFPCVLSYRPFQFRNCYLFPWWCSYPKVSTCVVLLHIHTYVME